MSLRTRPGLRTLEAGLVKVTLCADLYELTGLQHNNQDPDMEFCYVREHVHGRHWTAIRLTIAAALVASPADLARWGTRVAPV